MQSVWLSVFKYKYCSPRAR